MAVSKVVLNGNTLIDTTDKTVTDASMLSGVTALKNDGTTATGNIAAKTSADLSVSGATVTAPAGHYASAASASVASGSAGTPTATKGTVSNHSVSVTPSVTNTTGYISGGTKTGTAVTVTAAELESGTKSITSNGTNIDVTGYAAVDVSVSGGSIDVESLSVTQNGTYTAPTGKAYSPVVVNVSGGGTSAVQKQVNFIDYDGTILYSYTAQEANALTALPSNPSHSGLTAQGWNWTLAQIKAQLTAMPDGPVWVGQMYITQSGDTEIDVSMPDGRLSPILTIAVNGSVTVNWGDGTTASTVTGSSLTTRQAPSHTYAVSGDYTIVIHVVSGSFTFYGSSSYSLLRKNTTTNQNRVYSNCVQSVRFGSGVTSIGNYAFYNCQSLVSITIPSTVTSIGTYAFYYCYSLVSATIPSGVTSISERAFSGCGSLASATIPSTVTSIGTYAFANCNSLASITIPSTVTSIGNYAFNYCYSLASITIPGNVTSISEGTFSGCNSLASATIPSTVTSIGTSAFNGCQSLASLTIPSNVTSIGGSTFANCYSLASLTIPSTVTSIGSYAFNYCYGVAEYHVLPTTIPTLATGAFGNIVSDCVIYVPSEKLDDYKAAENWSAYASYMQGE